MTEDTATAITSLVSLSSFVDSDMIARTLFQLASKKLGLTAITLYRFGKKWSPIFEQPRKV